MIKSVIKSLFRSVGFEIQRVNVNKQRWSNSFINIDRLKNHNPSIDLLKYSDRKEPSKKFVGKLRSGQYKLIDRDCALCGGAII
jgi:hypothetical protein